MNATLSWGHCPTHGGVLIGSFGRCTRCEPTRLTVAQPRAPRRNPHLKGRPRSTDLTQAEEAVARLLASGLNQREIAAHLQLHHSSVSNTVRRACRRIGVVSDWDLIRYVRAKDLRVRVWRGRGIKP